MEDNPDQVIEDAKAHIIQYGAYRYGPPIQKLMDVVSGVRNYRMLPTTDQGFIYRKVIKNIEHNHIVDIDVMISKFWYAAIQAILRAKPIGVEVAVREGIVRKTKMSPLTFVRNHGVAAARKYVDHCCKRKLKQLCHDCNTISSLGRQRELDPGCKCGSKESKITHRFIKNAVRTCMDCGAKRKAIFERLCGTLTVDAATGAEYVVGGCGKTNISIIQVEDFIERDKADAWEWKFGTTDDTPEDHAIHSQMAKDVNEFADACIKALPADLSDLNQDSKTRKILRILVDPATARGICGECKGSNDWCGASIFSIDECTNYSRKLGSYFGYSATLANRRVKNIRKHVISFSIDHQHVFETARYIVEKLATAENPFMDHYYHELHKRNH